jgi:signal transduction histidine kinase
MLAGFWFGLRNALVTSLMITFLYLPFTILHWKGSTVEDINNVMEMILYNAVAVMLGFLRDRERAEQKRAQESERLAGMGKAVSGLAHDLKTPLVAIGGMSRFVKDHHREDRPCLEKLEIVIGEARRLEQMVDEMMDFSRPLKLNRSRSDFNQVISQNFAIIADLANGRGVKIQAQLAHDLPALSFDPQRMEQALINLLTNAAEASPEGETVTVHTYRKKRDLIVEVIDQGCGIPPDKREEIFFPFFTTKRGGTGLGLPIAKKIIEAHKGILEVLDNSEKGTIFRVVIPIVKDGIL